ncbi:hypothetical protein SAMN06269185_2802 [Natronoarchaeum philippinense]|uniref:Uncharacterized protein n=1 Tax=Natronoarchaeum philippinense TaxID=558529 RepID=A0A285P578_NATPI|nr:hypothetical protein [Natronoarchaeum philippinense]SNZ16892.1 hypothetical protein SAMN06269185_2802 [Natronoarchaeum philippinense]
MQRRTFLKVTGGGATAAATGIGAVALSGSAAASSSGSFTAENASVTNHDGEVSKVTATPTGSVSWSNFDEDVTTVDITIDSRILSSDQSSVLRGWEQVYHNAFALDGYADHSKSFSGQSLGTITLYGGDSGRPADAFDEPDDGASNDVVVQLRVSINLLGGDGNLADPQDEATIVDDQIKFRATATNAEATSAASGSFKTDMS